MRTHNTHKYCRTESAGTRKPAPALINQHRISGADGVFYGSRLEKAIFPLGTLLFVGPDRFFAGCRDKVEACRTAQVMGYQ